MAKQSKKFLKERKDNWFTLNIPIAFEHTKGICGRCENPCEIDEGMIHHNTYRSPKGYASIYELSYMELQKNNKVEWVCNPCHKKIHESESIDGNTKIRGICEFCKKRRGHSERAKTINRTEIMCKKCFRNEKKRIRLEDNGQQSLFPE